MPRSESRANLAGRNTTYDEPLSERIPVLFTRTQRRELEEKLGTKDISSWIRRVAIGEEEGPKTPIVDLGLKHFVGLSLLTTAPAGDFKEAIAQSSQFLLSKDVAEFIGATLGDVVVRVSGSSMEGAGIFDGQLLLMEILTAPAVPRRGDIALIQIHRKSGETEGTIKRWDKSGTPPRLLDGEDKEVPYPKDLIKVDAVARAKGIIGRI